MLPKEIKMFKPMKTPYRGITHMPMTDAALKKWKAKNCPKDIHCFDEVLSEEHYLVCDACGLTVHIAGIETEKQALERIAREHAGLRSKPVDALQALEQIREQIKPWLPKKKKHIKKTIRKYLRDNNYPGYGAVLREYRRP